MEEKKVEKKEDVKVEEKASKKPEVKADKKINEEQKKNNKIVLSVVAVVLVLVIIAGVVMILAKPKNNLNMQELNTTISKMQPFNQMATMDIDSDILNSLYEIAPEQYDLVVGKMPMMNIQASMYLIIKAKSGEVESVNEKVQNYAAKQEESWAKYLPEQYEIVKQRKQGVIGDYVYLIIAENSAEIESLINK